MLATLALPLSLTLVLAGPTAPAPAPQAIAVLPVTGDGVSLADLALLEDIDAVVRGAVGERKGVALQPRAVTAETFRSSRGAGVECKVSDLPCMRKIAALAGVDLMLVPVAAVEGEGVELELTLVSVVDESIVTRTVIIQGRGRAADAFVRATVDDVMTAPRVKVAAPVPPAPAAVAAAPAAPAPASAPAEAAPAADANEEGPLWPFVAGGVGAALLAIAAVTVGVVVASNALAPDGGGGGSGAGDPIAPTSGPVTVVLE